MENLEALSVSGRRVIEVNFGGGVEGGGAAERAAQLASVCAALKVPSVHVVAHGLGYSTAMQFVQARALVQRCVAKALDSTQCVRGSQFALVRG
eukprot:4455857-Pleurochrysis_carterae.AAC.1